MIIEGEEGEQRKNYLQSREGKESNMLKKSIKRSIDDYNQLEFAQLAKLWTRHVNNLNSARFKFNGKNHQYFTNEYKYTDQWE